MLLIVVFAGFPHGLAGSALWWSLDSGPFARSPRDVLTEASPVGAVRVFGDYPGADATAAARDTVDALEAAGGLDRMYLSINLPTGSGWVDPDQVEAMEDWADGDIASVAARYSAAPSAAVLLLQRDLATDSAEALIREIVDRVSAYPADDRPQIIVHGQSLGAAVGTDILAADPALADAVSVILWQGLPGGADNAAGAAGASGTAPSDRCTVSELNDDDPVGKLSPSLLTDPVGAVRVLTDLPGSENAPVGSGHSYGGVVPPAGCVS
ncbi:alpha/beta-hydrolase family protein [uncultured Corynebacterium sp.]|uniref:alpha/beta-hydrolase family protein n=1 Tax=uncultured Corynebacterium sp. TaxID=159447 RepID=UPI00345B7FDB